ncbi:type VI secretion system-associated FHA domain protein TagH [Sulfurimonas sp.]
MELVFDIVKSGKNIPSKKNFHFNEEGGTIGRLEDNDWVLTDPNSYISGMHASIICKQGTYFIKDESTNGIFLKNPYKKLPKGHPVKINISDIFIIGDHEIQARFSNNDYTQDDIISSFEENSSLDDTIIPSDDFLFDSISNDFTSIDSQTPSEIEIVDIIQNNVEQQDNSILGDISEIDTQEVLLEEHIDIPSYKQESPSVTPERTQASDIHTSVNGLESSVAILESKLGIEINALEQKDRDAIMHEIGDIIKKTLDSLKNSLEIKDKIKQDLRLSTAHLDTNSNNPVHLGAAATELLQNKNNGSMLGMMKVSEAIEKSFNELDTHSISLHRASKNLMNITVSKFSPKNLEHRFEATGALRGVLPRQNLLWKAYTDMFDILNENPEEGVVMIHNEFMKEYENMSYSLKLQTPQTRNKI